MSQSKKSHHSSSSRTESGSSSRRDRQIRRYITRAIILLTVVAFIGFGFWYGFRVVRKQRAMASAREFADKKEFMQAAISARRALQISPSDLAANRLMAEMAEALNLKEAVNWRKTVAEMQPGVAQNYLDWASVAMRFKDAPSAREALSKLDEKGRNTAMFHDVSARLAVLSGKTSEVYAHVLAAAQLDPNNESYQLQLAAIQLGSPIVEVRKGAVATVEQLAESPKIRREALRTLIQATLTNRENSRALKFANQLMTGAGATFDDRMLFLKLLGQLKNPEYWWFLAQLGSDLPAKDVDLVTLLSWMNNNGLPTLTLTWTKDLPNDRADRVPVCVAIAEAHTLLGNWGKLNSLLRLQKDWGDLQFQYEALSARVARAEGNIDSSKSHWTAAVQLAAGKKEPLAALERFVLAWGWEEEYTNLLWDVAKGGAQSRAALQQLLRKYTAEGNARDLLRVFNLMYEDDVKNKITNLNTNNNLAYALLILNVEPERAHTLARDAHNSDPTNAQFAATYALALYGRDKFDDAFKILRQLDERDLRNPSNALCYGVVLAAKEMTDQARVYLDIAENGNLLPEEKKLAERARAKLPR